MEKEDFEEIGRELSRLREKRKWLTQQIDHQYRLEQQAREHSQAFQTQRNELDEELSKFLAGEDDVLGS